MKLRQLITLPIAVALAATLTGPAAVADNDFGAPSLKATSTSSKATQAKNTLAQVKAIADGDARSRSGRTADGRDLTVALRDLRMQMKYLSPAAQKEAQRFLMRPGSGGDPWIPGALPINTCSGELCVHYAETGTNAVLGSDGDAATIPAYVTQVSTTINQINADYVDAGYKTPKRDGGIGGGSNKIDIYLGDIGPQGLYGFCTSDDPNDPSTSGDYSLWAYCALDNDYDPSEFPTNTPTENMQVTAAHEFFHAVQYAYDAYEDGWILESTATWAEDEMFDNVDDNRQYLAFSPMSDPYIPLDYFGDGGYHYGVWIWWRYLTEKFPTKTGKLPNLVLKVWKRLDGTPTGPDNYSTQGLAKELVARKTTLAKELQLFYAANRHPSDTYSEGAAYPASPVTAVTIKAAHPNPNAYGTKFDHMSSQTLRFSPKGMTKPDWKLKLAFDAPPPSRGGAFVVLVWKKSGAVQTSLIKLNKKGNATKSFPFSNGSVKGVDVVFVNTSARFKCYQNATPFSCFGGIPKDDQLKYTVDPKAFRA